jgi:hypothetical protein
VVSVKVYRGEELLGAMDIGGKRIFNAIRGDDDCIAVSGNESDQGSSD